MRVRASIHTSPCGLRWLTSTASYVGNLRLMACTSWAPPTAPGASRQGRTFKSPRVAPPVEADIHGGRRQPPEVCGGQDSLSFVCPRTVEVDPNQRIRRQSAGSSARRKLVRKSGRDVVFPPSVFAACRNRCGCRPRAEFAYLTATKPTEPRQEFCSNIIGARRGQQF